MSTGFNLRGIFFCTWLALCTGACASKETSQQTEDGLLIPGKSLFQFSEYEYICEPTLEKDHTEMERLLDRYGRSGWKLAGFMHKNGDTYAFCMMR